MVLSPSKILSGGGKIEDTYQEITDIKNVLNNLTKTMEPGSALLFRDAESLGFTNLTYGYWASGLYLYNGYYEGAPSDYAGILLVFHTGTFYIKYAFTAGCEIYMMRNNEDGSVSQSWTKI